MPSNASMEELLEIHPCAPTLAYGPTSHEIKHDRRYVSLKFCYCGEVGREFKTCARCKSAFYCSRKCQKYSWPEHKKICQPPDSAFDKLLQFFIANESTKLHLQMAIILKFYLINKNIDRTRPAFDALMDAVILPTDDNDIRNLMDAVKHQELWDVEIEGMLQLSNGDQPYKVDDVIWKPADEPEYSDCWRHGPTGYVRFRDMASSEEEQGEAKIMTHVLGIPQLAIDLMQAAKVVVCDMGVPMTAEGCFQ
ncbi:hypothetical protein M413DRAFT_13434 [Hebeloma cylindrosporum]|uniref:MYND-type domain-containing protein n=1 Tax=Hebeloma cylindrosporum TaxID=76867 RepID=A0A0C3BYZ0_HEBCY|nr:hypothetical protein M413DRAFT_13434 [Hebeloma cylindrosporum h7]